MTPEDRFNAALDAWQEWCEAKRKSDVTMSFVDCHRTAQAWVRFQNLYLGDNRPLATMPAPSAVVMPFSGEA